MKRQAARRASARATAAPPLATLPDRPPRPRDKILKSEWVDPDDIKPGAQHHPRTITGWRAFCPLRRIMRNSSSAITAGHVHAADHLRALYDHARLGFSAPLNLSQGGILLAHGPSLGPSQAAITQARAAAELERALSRFTAGQQRMLHSIVLNNASLQVWVRSEQARTALPQDPRLEQGKLVAILDLLAEHFRGEIDAALQRGAILPVS